MLFVLVITAANIYGQAKKPTIMVLPADIWCNRNGYVQKIDNMGTIENVSNYKTALQNNSDMRAMISAMGDFMQKENFPIESLETALRNAESDAAFDMVNSSQSGNVSSESPKEKLLSQAKPDIILDLDFEEVKMGPKSAIRFNLQAIDAYTGNIISGNVGQGTPSSASDKTNQLTEVVLSFKDNFLSGLMNHFNSMFKDGREIIVEVARWDDCPIDFEEEYDDSELGELIENWMFENTVSGRFSTQMATENRMKFNQVRIPLYNEKGRPIDARAWGRGLAKFIKKTTQQECDVTGRGLGLVRITMGGK